MIEYLLYLEKIWLKITGKHKNYYGNNLIFIPEFKDNMIIITFLESIENQFLFDYLNILFTNY
jgi:hypothetical protein